jgi:hypothetical protein
MMASKDTSAAARVAALQQGGRPAAHQLACSVRPPPA